MKGLARKWWLLSLVLIGGCLQPGATFDFGVGTNTISGEIEFGGKVPGQSDGLIVVFKHHYKFLPRFDLEDDKQVSPPAGSLTHPTAHIVPLESTGRFSISIPGDVVSVTILFIAADRETDTFGFSRSLGIGNVHYRANLRPVEGWRNHFYTYLEPQLKHLIVERRYGLSNRDQMWLTSWLDRQKDRLSTKSPRD